MADDVKPGENGKTGKTGKTAKDGKEGRPMPDLFQKQEAPIPGLLADVLLPRRQERDGDGKE